MSIFDANLNNLPRYVWNNLPSFHILEDMNDQSQILLKKMTFIPIIFSTE